MRIPLPDPVPVVRLAAGERLWRVHRREHEPLWFGPAPSAPPRNRFDAPGGEYRVCYLGATLGVSILETLVRGRRRPIIAQEELEARSASLIALEQPLRLL